MNGLDLETIIAQGELFIASRRAIFNFLSRSLNKSFLISRLGQKDAELEIKSGDVKRIQVNDGYHVAFRYFGESCIDSESPLFNFVTNDGNEVFIYKDSHYKVNPGKEGNEITEEEYKKMNGDIYIAILLIRLKLNEYPNLNRKEL